jgi:hypothetical protein
MLIVNHVIQKLNIKKIIKAIDFFIILIHIGINVAGQHKI